MRPSLSSVFASLVVLLDLAFAQWQTAETTCDSTTGLCSQSFYDQDMDVTFSISAPVVDSGEFIMQIKAPGNFGWTGLTLGDSFEDNLMIAVWPNGNEIVVSPRMGMGYVPPPPYTGPSIEMLPGTGWGGFNNNYIIANFRCVACTSWEGGSLNMESTFQQLSYAISTSAIPAQRSNPASPVPMFTISNWFFVNMQEAKTTTYTDVQ